jgi:hypothetical protein
MRTQDTFPGVVPAKVGIKYYQVLLVQLFRGCDTYDEFM